MDMQSPQNVLGAVTKLYYTILYYTNYTKKFSRNSNFVRVS